MTIKSSAYNIVIILIEMILYKMEKLKINGSERQFPSGMPRTLAELLEQLSINQATIVAEVDGNIIERRDFAQTTLSNGQSIELIRFVGGG